MVELEHATESITAFDLAGDGSDSFLRLDKLIAQTLMVPFCMVVLDVFTHGVFQ